MQKDILQIESSRSGNNYQLRLYFANDEKGIVYRVTSVLFGNDWNIMGANIRSLENGQVEDEFLIHNPLGRLLDAEELEKLRLEMERLFREEISITSYMIKKGKLSNSQKGSASSTVQFENIDHLDVTRVMIQTQDRSGLLWDISRILFLECMDILSVQANTKGNLVQDIFDIRSESGHKLDGIMLERLERNLKKIL